jgi:flagellar motility protein MotE (MotC chaperone)
MKKLLAIGLVTFLLFGASAGVSWYLKEHNPLNVSAQPAQDAASQSSDHRFVLPIQGDDSNQPGGSGQRSVARPSYSAGAEEAVQLATSLRERLASVREKENQLALRQKNLELVYEDISGERSAIDDLRKQVGEELVALEEKMVGVEKRYSETVQQRDETSSRLAQMKKDVTQLEGVEQVNFTKMANTCDSMEPESAARILEQLANSAKMDTAVKLLAQMKERQAAKVLAALPADSGLAAQLLDKLRSYRKPAASAKKQGGAG